MFTSQNSNKLYEELINYYTQLQNMTKLELDTKKVKKLEKELTIINNLSRTLLKTINFYKNLEQEQATPKRKI